MRNLLLFLIIYLGFSTSQSQATVKITCPNGGEKFVIGSDTLITWEGILPTDTVKLEYSIDSGISWKIISDEVTGLKYTWKSIPAPPRNKCLIRISQIIKFDTSYKEIKIGNQNWMGRNLNVDHYRNGDPIEYVSNWSTWFSLKTGAWCYYNNNNKMSSDYGKLYNAFAVNDPRGLAPIGWHVASDDDWTELEKYLGGHYVAGGKLKSTGTIEDKDGLWHYPNLGATNASGFSAIPGGKRSRTEGFDLLGYSSQWWSSTICDSLNSFFRVINYDDKEITRYGCTSEYGMSIRCVRDAYSAVSGVFSIVVPEARAFDVDMKKCLVGTPKDSTVNNFVYNSSSYKFSVDSIYFRGADADAFLLLSGLPKYELEPSEGMDTKFRFIPSRIGVHTAEIVIIGQTDTLIQTIQGEGYKIYPEIEALIMPFADLICESTISNELIISNPGGNTLIVEKLNIKGSNQDEFAISEALPITIEPAQSRKLSITFRPKSIGTKTAELEIISNAHPDIVFTIPLSAKKDSVNLSFNEGTIDLGYLCPGETKDTSISIRNFGSIKTGAYLTNSANISSGKNVTVLQPSNSDNITFTFNGLSTEGNINETITLTDSICGFSKVINIIGKSALPIISATDISITTILNVPNQGTITLKNIGERDVKIANQPVINPPFSLVGNPFPAIIKAKDSLKIEIEFLPTDLQTHTATIKLFGEPCGLNYEIIVTGNISLPSAIIATDTVSAYAGDTINIAIKLKDESYLDLSGITSFQTDLLFNPSVLTPLDRITYPVQKINDKLAKIEIRNIPFTLEVGSTLITIPFIAGLGNTETCELLLNNAKSDNENFNIETQSGLFKLLGICREGGTRLINPTGKAEILSIIPNPASDDVEIKVYLIEDGNSVLSVFNSNGVKIKEFSYKGITGLQTINLNGRDFANGLYFIILRTPTVVESQKLIIVK